MPKPKAPLTPAEEYRGFQRLRRIRKREKAHALRIQKAREKAEQSRLRRLDQHARAEYVLERQIRLMERHPSPLVAVRLGEILQDPDTPEGARVKASLLIMKLASHGDGPSPG